MRIFVPVMAVSSICYVLERKALKYAIVPFLQELRCLKVLRFEVGYPAWLFANWGMSTLCMLSIHTDAFFVAMTVHSEFLCSSPELLQIWRELMEQSMLGALPLTWEFWNPAVAVLVCWAVSSLQLLVAAAHVLQPRRSQKGGQLNQVLDLTEESVKFRPWNDRTCTGGEVRYSTYAKLLMFDGWKWKSTFGESLTWVATIGGWSSIKHMSVSYYISQLDKILDKKEPGWELQSTRSIRMMVRSALTRTIFGAFLKSSVQLNIQITFFVLHRAMMGRTAKRLDLLALLSIILAFATALPFDVHLFLSCMKRSRRAFREVRQSQVYKDARLQPKLHARTEAGTAEFGVCMVADCKAAPRKQGHKLCWAHQNAEWLVEESRQAYRSTLCLVFWFTLYISLVVYAIAKLVAGFTCRDSIWNLAGCAQLHEEALKAINECNSRLAQASSAGGPFAV